MDRFGGDGRTIPLRHHPLVTTYRIVVEGELSDRFVATFSDMDLERDRGTTVLTGDVRDQAHLQGLLSRISDLGLALHSVTPIDRTPSDAVDG